MKVCVFGAGAIGSYLAVELALAGHEVCAVARGPHLAAIRRNGLTLLIDGTSRSAPLAASDDPREFGPQDVVFCALKAHQAHAAAASFAPLLGPETAVVTAMNGIPWWYFHRSGGQHEGRHLESVDEGSLQWRLIGPARAIGCVVDPACTIVEPGIVRHEKFKRFILGEPDGTRSDRVVGLAAAMVEAGFEAPVRDDIRWNIWLKLWGNVCFNPISMLTLATLDRIVTEPGLRALCETIMEETRGVNEAFGVHIPIDMMHRRLAAAGSVVGHKMSMLQDLEKGRSVELDAILGAVQELARLAGLATPMIDMVLALARERARSAGL